MFIIDNPGRGDCLFYAYATSLILFLKKRNNLEFTGLILNNITTLNAEDKEFIRTCLKSFY